MTQSLRRKRKMNLNDQTPATPLPDGPWHSVMMQGCWTCVGCGNYLDAGQVAFYYIEPVGRPCSRMSLVCVVCMQTLAKRGTARL